MPLEMRHRSGIQQFTDGLNFFLSEKRWHTICLLQRFGRRE